MLRMRQVALVAAVSCAVFGTAQAEPKAKSTAIDRPGLALELFNTYCMPYLRRDLVLPEKGTEGLEEWSYDFNPNLDELIAVWRHVDSNLRLHVHEHWRGRVNCEVSDEFQGFGPWHSYRFRNLLNNMMVGAFPKVVPNEGSEETEIPPGELFEVFVRAWDLGPQDDGAKAAIFYLKGISKDRQTSRAVLWWMPGTED